MSFRAKSRLQRSGRSPRGHAFHPWPNSRVDSRDVSTSLDITASLWPFHVLERHDPPIFECDDLVRDWNARRDVSVIERIVEWIAEESEPAAVMKCSDKANTGAEAIAPAPRPIGPPIGVGSSF